MTEVDDVATVLQRAHERLRIEWGGRAPLLGCGRGRSGHDVTRRHEHRHQAARVGGGTGVGSNAASFLLGLPSSGSFPRNADAFWSQHFEAFYVQNDWRVTPRLTVNMGLRYDWETPEGGGHMRSPHTIEIQFVFNNIKIAGPRISTMPEAYALADKTSTAWAAFARTGDPNTPKLPKWPAEEDWEQATLDQLRAWDWAAENASVLRQQKLDVALTTYALKEKKEEDP